MDAQLILDAPQSGAWNMAADQILLDTADQEGIASLRFYRWSSPTLSIGYFQQTNDRANHQKSAHIDWVRRSTGGGAIVHDREITYSLALPIDDRGVGEHKSLYQIVHRSIINVLRHYGALAVPYNHTSTTCLSEKRICTDSWLCFQRRTGEDLIVGGYKIAGSAQRRGRNSMLQHGSILLSVSEHSPELPGVAELCGRPVAAAEAEERLAKEISKNLGVGLTRRDWTENQRILVENMLDERYGADDWNNRR